MESPLKGKGHGGSSPDPLVKELTVILLVKVAVLMVIWAAFFSGPEQGASSGAVASRILPSHAAQTPAHAD